jgi:hypothetical protein
MNRLLIYGRADSYSDPNLLRALPTKKTAKFPVLKRINTASAPLACQEKMRANGLVWLPYIASRVAHDEFGDDSAMNCADGFLFEGSVDRLKHNRGGGSAHNFHRLAHRR